MKTDTQCSGDCNQGRNCTCRAGMSEHDIQYFKKWAVTFAVLAVVWVLL